MIQHRDPGDESEAAMTDERAAVRSSFFGREFVPASDYDALRAENERLRDDKIDLLGTLRAIGDRVGEDGDELAILARVSELTRLLAEAEENLKMSSAQVRAAERTIRALQSGEGKEPSR